MKNSFSVIILIALGIVFFAYQRDAIKPGQTDLLTHAMAASQESGKPVLIDFYTTWCPPCKRFDKDAKSDRDIMGQLSKVEFIKIDCEEGPGRDLAKQYKVDAYPTFVVLDAEGKTQHRWKGYSKRGFLKQLEYALP